VLRGRSVFLLLWMSPWAGVVLADFFIKRRSVAELYRAPDVSAYGDINWSGIIAFLVGLIAGWSVEDGLVQALQGPISTGAARRRGPELARWDRRLGRGLLGAWQARRACADGVAKRMSQTVSLARVV
jgi:hypothetical protein